MAQILRIGMIIPAVLLFYGMKCIGGKNVYGFIDAHPDNFIGRSDPFGTLPGYVSEYTYLYGR